MRAVLLTLLVLVAALTSAQSLAISKGGAFSPSQYANTQVTYTITLKGADKTTLSIDGGTGVGFSNTKTVTLDGSKPHQFQVLQVICQSGWECGDQVSDWRNGKRLYASQATWTVPAGTTQTTTQTETIPEYETVCLSYDPHTGSCTSYGEEFVGYYTQTYTQETFTPPCKPCQFTFEYSPQYRLVWNDNYSSVSLYEWFDSCESVTLLPPSGYSSLGHGDTVAGSAGVRYAFNAWTSDSGSVVNQVTMCAPHEVTATYLTQYQLQLNSQCPDVFQPAGAGWYNAGSNAPISIQENAPMGGFLGLLGGRFIFDGWVGTVGVMGTPTANVFMGQPQTYTATCRADYTWPAIGGFIIIIFIGGAFIIFRPGGRWPRRRRIRRGRDGRGRGLPPNVTGNATLTRTNGTQTQLTTGNLNQVGPGTTVDTGPQSFVRVQTPIASNSQSVIGQDSRVSLLDPTPKTPIPWLKFPGLSQIYNAGSLLLRVDFGKLLLNWAERAATQEAVIILPASLIGAATSAAMSRWLARIKGTMVLVEAVQDGTAAAITVLEGEGAKESSAELWRSDDLNVIEIHAGERVILKAGRRPTKINVDLAKGLGQQIQDPFSILHKWWTLPPISDETNAALTTPSQTSSGTTAGENTTSCTSCGRKIPDTLKFCTYCGQQQQRPK